MSMVNAENFQSLWGNNSFSPLSPSIVASAGTTPVTHPIMYLSGTAAVTLLTLPYDGFKGVVIFVPTGAVVFTSGGTATTANKPVRVTHTCVANKPVFAICDGAFWDVMAIA